MGEEIDERAGGRFYGIAVVIDSVRLDGSQVSQATEERQSVDGLD